MDGIFETLTLGEAVARDHRAAAVFARHGLDFCCVGRRTIGDACRESGVNPAVLYDELRAASDAPHPGDEVAGWSTDRVVDRIVRHHHTYVRTWAPIIEAHLAKAVATHGRSHHQLLRIQQLFGELTEDLTRHIDWEERDLFPGIVRSSHDQGTLPGGLAQAIAAAEDEHRAVGAALQSIRVLSDDYTTPPHACATWRVCYEALQDFEHDMHEHVHLENNVLFPAVSNLTPTAGDVPTAHIRETRP